MKKFIAVGLAMTMGCVALAEHEVPGAVGGSAAAAGVTMLKKPTVETRFGECKSLMPKQSLKAEKDNDFPGPGMPPNDVMQFACAKSHSFFRCTLIFPMDAEGPIQCTWISETDDWNKLTKPVNAKCVDSLDVSRSVLLHFAKDSVSFVMDPNFEPYVEGNVTYKNLFACKASLTGELSVVATATPKNKPDEISHIRVKRSCGKGFGLTAKTVDHGPKGWTDLRKDKAIQKTFSSVFGGLKEDWTAEARN